MMRTSILAKWCFLVIVLLFALNSFSQRERVHLDLNRYNFKAGDTIYLSGIVLKGNHLSALSKSLYAELYTEDGLLLRRLVFPVIHGQSVGQIVIPDSLPTANYYIRALTRQQLNYNSQDFFTVPVLVYNRDKPAVIHHKSPILLPGVVASGTINGISWLTTLYKGKISSSVEIDSGTRPRKLQLIDRISADSLVGDAVSLDSSIRQQYCLFPLHADRDSEVLFLLEDSVLIGRQVIRVKDRPEVAQLSTDTLDLSALGHNSWRLDLPGTAAWYTSISVTDADRTSPSPAPITRLNDSYTDDYTVTGPADSAYISIEGKATREFGKKFKDLDAVQLVIAGVRDTNYLFTKAVNMDGEGHFNLDSLFFFGSISLQYQVNGPEIANGKDIKLHVSAYTPPPADSSLFVQNWEDNAVAIGTIDTAYTSQELSQRELATMQTLKTAVVHSWKNPRQELDDAYTKGPFSMPALFSYDLRTDSSDYNRDIFQYINAQSGRLRYDIYGDSLVDALNHPIHYFVDEQEYPAYALRTFDFDGLAYVKIPESDGLSTQENQFSLVSAESGPSASGKQNSLRLPDQKTAINVCVYTRKGKDFRTMRGGMKAGVTITGYSELFPPLKTDNVTLYWRPIEAGHSFHIAFDNNETTKRFRIKVEGVNTAGEVIHYEKVIEK
jgi:hypothetical protein